MIQHKKNFWNIGERQNNIINDKNYTLLKIPIISQALFSFHFNLFWLHQFMPLQMKTMELFDWIMALRKSVHGRTLFYFFF